MTAHTQQKVLLTGALCVSVALSGCASRSRHEVEEAPDGMSHSMMDMMMCDPCCGALLQLLKSVAPTAEPSGGAHATRNEAGAATTPRPSGCQEIEDPD